MSHKNLDPVDPTAVESWNEVVSSLKKATFFHSSYWANVLAQSYGYKPIYFANFENHSIDSLLPLMQISSRVTGRRAVSLPFTDFCEPLFEDQNIFDEIINNIFSFGEKSSWKYVELRGGSTWLPGRKSSLQYYRHRLTLSSETVLWKNLQSNTRRNINKAEREGVRVVIDNSSQGMENFYRLNCLTRKKHGLPPQPKFFFNNVYRFIINNNSGHIFVAKKDNRLLAAAIYFHFGSQAIYKYGASDAKFLDWRANNLVMWEAIKFYVANKFTEFDFGKTEISNQGLRRFKLGWGAEEKIVNYHKYDFSKKDFIKENNQESGWYNFFFRNMPLPLLKATGKMLYKMVG